MQQKETKRPDAARYYIAKEENTGHELVFRVDDEVESPRPKFLIRSRNRADSLDTILNDMCANVCTVRSSRQLVESLFGEPAWKYGSESEGYNYDFGPKAERLYPEPEPEEAAVKEKSQPQSSGSLQPYCRKHLRDKYKDGRTKGGKQKYRCPMCERGEPEVTDPAQANQGVRRRKAKGPRARKSSISPGSHRTMAQAASVTARVKKNPKCKTCGERLRVGNRHKLADGTQTTYWKCVNKCPQKAEPDWKLWNGEQLEAHFTKLVAGVNGHDPQLRGDVVHEMITDALSEKRTFAELHNPKVIRQYIKSQARLSQDKFDCPSLDAPVRADDGDGQTFADRLESPVMNPEEELMAKEDAYVHRQD